VRRRILALVAVSVAVALTLAGCGGDDDTSSTASDVTSPSDDAPTIGFMQTPAPKVGDVSLPELGASGGEFRLRAPAGKLLLVFFGYSNCPDICPGTMANIKAVLARLDERASNIEVAMVTVDPARDLEALPDYVRAYVPDGHALGTDDPVALQRAADAFGVVYTVQDLPGGEADVGHTSSLFAVDDKGSLLITWTFGVTPTDLTSDITYLLDHHV